MVKNSYIQNTYISLEGVGFGEGLGKFASIISLKLLFPTFLASCNINIQNIVNSLPLVNRLLLFAFHIFVYVLFFI